MQFPNEGKRVNGTFIGLYFVRSDRPRRRRKEAERRTEAEMITLSRAGSKSLIQVNGIKLTMPFP